MADGMARFASVAILIGGSLAILLALDRVGDFTRRAGAYYALVLLATAGMVAMVDRQQFHDDLPGARNPLRGALHPRRFQPTRHAVGRGGAEILPAGRVRQRLFPLRHRADLRGNRHNLPGWDQQGAGAAVRPAAVRAPAADRRGAADRGFRVQGGAGAVPHVDARRLPGRADAGHGVHVGGDEGRGIHGAVARARQPG